MTAPDASTQPAGCLRYRTLLRASRLSAPPPCQEFISLHHNGTLTETNNALHAHPIAGSPLVTASERFGAWQRSASGRVEFQFLKMVFCGSEFDSSTNFLLGVILGQDCRTVPLTRPVRQLKGSGCLRTHNEL
jgi:hypothetical protein